MAHFNPRFPNQYHKDCYLTDELFTRRNSESPDFLELKAFENIPIFVYGPEMTGGKLNKFVTSDPSTIFLGEAKSCTESYVMEKADWDGPVLFKSGAVQNSRRVYGEVYLVSPRVILNLDKLNANQEVTKREKFYFWLMEQTVKDKPNLHPALKCWVYLADWDYWETQQTVSMETKKSGKEEYYEWTNDEQFEIPAFLKGEVQSRLL